VSTLRNRARRVGVVYFVMSVLQMPVLLYLPHFIVPENASETARRISDGAHVYRLMMLSELAASILFIVLGWSLYRLFETVDRKLSMLMLLLVLASATLGIVDVAFLSPPLVLHMYAASLSSFTPAQIDALGFALLQIRSVAVHANEALWGVWLIPFGILAMRCGFVPRIFGMLLLVASVGYVAMSFTFIGFPDYGGIVNGIGSLLVVGELPMIVWLLTKGAMVGREGFGE
jgi:hypothetical protein